MAKNVEQLLLALRRALFESGAAREELRSVLAEMRRAGLSIYLVADGGGETDLEAIPLSPADDSGTPPVFRIGQEDLAILRDLGIDPTRTLRRRR